MKDSDSDRSDKTWWGDPDGFLRSTDRAIRKTIEKFKNDYMRSVRSSGRHPRPPRLRFSSIEMPLDNEEEDATERVFAEVDNKFINEGRIFPK